MRGRVSQTGVHYGKKAIFLLVNGKMEGNYCFFASFSPIHDGRHDQSGPRGRPGAGLPSNGRGSKPTTIPVIIDVAKMPFIMVSGTGDPNGEEFARATEALYSLSYAIKMSYKSADVPVGYYEYTVFPLEGIWDLVDRSKPATDKNNFKYTIMIRQPDFLTDELFMKFVEQTKKKKPNPYLGKLIFGEMTDGLCCQVMHIGSYDDEPESFAKMEVFCEEQGYVRSDKAHREIYLSGPRKTEQLVMKTVLRFSVMEEAPKPLYNVIISCKTRQAGQQQHNNIIIGGGYEKDEISRAFRVES